MAVAHIEIAVSAINSHTAPEEFAASQRVIVVIELEKRDRALAIFEQAVFKGGFGKGLTVSGMILEDGRVGEPAERQVSMVNVRRVARSVCNAKPVISMLQKDDT